MKLKINKILIVTLFLLGFISPAFSSTIIKKEVKLTNSIAWVKLSDEYKSCVSQAYQNAIKRLIKLQKKVKNEKWCVVFDMDETIISNVKYEADNELAGKAFSKASWLDWCNKAEGTPLPGVLDFACMIKKMGGKVIVITNRSGATKKASLCNLHKIGFPFDALILKEGPYAKDKNKNLRRKDLKNGTIKILHPGIKLPPLKILMLAGDQSHDLYDVTKYSFQDIKEHFAKDYIIIPNPMYGDWIEKHKTKKKAQ